MKHTLQIVLLLSLFQIACLCLDTIVTTNYSAFEHLVLTDENTDRLSSAFFPENHHRAVTVSVSYQFVWAGDNMTIDEANSSTTVLYYQWSSSPVHLFINPSLLSGLSLYTYRMENQTVEIVIETSCCLQDISNKIHTVKDVLSHNCTLHNSVANVLNRFTLNLQSYALHKTKVESDGISSTEKGYSVYYMDPKIWSQYCVINDETPIYRTQRYILNVGTLIFVFVALIGSPLIFIALYRSILKESSKNNSSKFIIWSVGFSSTIASGVIIANDIITIIHLFKSKLYQKDTDIFIDLYYFSRTFSVMLGIFFVLNCVSFLLPMYYISSNDDLKKKLEVPQCCNALANKLNCCCPWASKSLLCRECVALFISHVGCSYFLELLAFHILYIVLGAIVTPIETLSTIFFYMAIYFFLVVIGAITLRAWDTSFFKKKYHNVCLCYIPLLILILLFLFCFGGFIYFFKTYITLVQTYSTSQGIWHVIGSILPTAIVTSLGIWGKHLLDKMKQQDNENTPNDEIKDDGTGTGSESLSTSDAKIGGTSGLKGGACGVGEVSRHADTEGNIVHEGSRIRGEVHHDGVGTNSSKGSGKSSQKKKFSLIDKRKIETSDSDNTSRDAASPKTPSPKRLVPAIVHIKTTSETGEEASVPLLSEET